MFKREIKNQLEALFDQVDKDQLFLPENGSKKPRFLCYYNLIVISYLGMKRNVFRSNRFFFENIIEGCFSARGQSPRAEKQSRDNI